MQINKKHSPIVLTIAGSDSSGGAGIQGDIKAISATGSYAASVVTALTAQNTQGVQAIQQIPAHFVQQQMHSVFSDLTVHAVKIGMLYNKSIIDIVSQQLKKFKPKYIVLDPVMLAKSGQPLLHIQPVSYLADKLGFISTLITPNIPEVAALFGIQIKHVQEMEKAAQTIAQKMRTNILIKGGHLTEQESPDILYLYAEKRGHWFVTPRISTHHTHGTGCALSAAIASFLAQGYSLYDAIELAKKYLTKAIWSGSKLKIGQGKGPVDHFVKDE